jgi:hypothetical protein
MERPTSVTVLAIFCFILGGFGLLGVAMGVVGLAFGATFLTLSPEIRNLLQEHVQPGQMVYGVVSGTLDAAVAVGLLAAGYGLLKLYEWARKLAVWLAVASIALALIDLVAGIAMGFANYEKYMRPQMQQAGAPLPEGLMQAFVIGGSTCGFLIAIIFPIFLLVFMTRPHVKEAFAARQEASLDDGYAEE